MEVELNRSSTLISYIAAENALVGPEDAGILVNSIEMMLPGGGKLDRLDLFLHSPGGFLDAAYKLVQICKEYSKEFNVIVPVAAKSAATVICLGAHEIVMTSFAELGPIDPIVQHPYKPEVRVPARSIKDFFEFLSSTETKGQITVDQSFKAQMASLPDPYLIGSYQTALKSSKQIAAILLAEGMLKDTPEKIADTVDRLTEYYYSHAFVIDRTTARNLGLNVKGAEDNRALSNAIRQLFFVYQRFMQDNRIVKLIGNREVNHNVQLPAPPVVSATPAGAVNLQF